MRSYIGRVGKGSLKRNTLYSLCIKASLAKCYEFNQAIPSMDRSKSAFFAMPALRGICEDLIVLRYIGTLPPSDRAELLHALTAHQLAKRVKIQDIFFRSFRPQQPVLRFKDADSQITSSEAAAQAVWRRNGWPNMQRNEMPPVRQIAQKQGLHHMAVLYDYLYRLTSANVHFGVQSLLRSGWGPTPNAFVFSTQNFSGYFEQYCSLYGAFLFCLYFEFFGRLLRPDQRQRENVQNIRHNIFMSPRWPEMVTFEEMNQKPPEDGQMFRLVISAAQTTMQRHLIPRGASFGDKRSASHKFARQALRIVAAGLAADRKKKSLESPNETPGV
jgi:hypothetical protein